MALYRCPSCESEMEKIKAPDITIDRCPDCGGTYLDKGELDVLATGMKGEIEFCSVEFGSVDEKERHLPRNCPKPSCNGNRMRKIDLLSHSNTVFDYCEECEGFFLDKGEIEQTNLELEELVKDNLAEEFRGYIDGYLVRLDVITDVFASVVRQN